MCAWLNITERHARKLVERGAIPYRKVGHLLRFPEAEIEEWSRPRPTRRLARVEHRHANIYGHLFAQDRAAVLDAMNEAVSRLYAYEAPEAGDEGRKGRAA